MASYERSGMDFGTHLLSLEVGLGGSSLLCCLLSEYPICLCRRRLPIWSHVVPAYRLADTAAMGRSRRESANLDRCILWATSTTPSSPSGQVIQSVCAAHKQSPSGDHGAKCASCERFLLFAVPRTHGPSRTASFSKPLAEVGPRVHGCPTQCR